MLQAWQAQGSRRLEDCRTFRFFAAYTADRPAVVSLALTQPAMHVFW